MINMMKRVKLVGGINLTCGGLGVCGFVGIKEIKSVRKRVNLMGKQSANFDYKIRKEAADREG